MTDLYLSILAGVIALILGSIITILFFGQFTLCEND